MENISKDKFFVNPIPKNDYFTVIALKKNLPFRSVRLLNLKGVEVAITKKYSFTQTPLRFGTGYVPTVSYILAIETPNGTNFKNVIIC